MNLQFFLIKAILNASIYSKYAVSIEANLQQNQELLKIFLSSKNHYSKTPEKSIESVDNLELMFYMDYPMLSGKDKSLYPDIFDKLRSVNADPALMEKYLLQVQRSNLALELATKAVELSEDGGSYLPLSEMDARLQDDSNELQEDLPVVDDNLNTLLENQIETGGIPWRLDCLNKSLGPLRKGDFGFIFKRPETGGTTFLASEVSYMAGKVDGPILWFNNEEQSEKVLLRCYQAVLGSSINDLRLHREESYKKYQESTGGRIVFPDISNAPSFDVIRNYCSEYGPALVVIDQIDKIAGFKEDRKDLEYGQIYRWVRELAKEFCPVIGVSQASASAENKMWLAMDDIAESKTSKAAEADWIMGIGALNEEGKKSLRYFSICKNKLVGGIYTDEKMRHGRITAIIQPEIARYKDIV